LYWKTPIKIKNSPIKLLVKGKLIFAKEKIRKRIAKIGQKKANPPKYFILLTIFLPSF
jgi:hypothetical protein